MFSLVLYGVFLSNHSWFASKMASPWGVLVVSRWRWKWPRLRRLWPSGGPHALPQVGPCGIHLALITHRGCNKKHLFRPCSSVLGDGFMMVLWWFLIWDETWCWNFLNTTLNQFTDNNNCSLQQPPILRIEHGNDMRPLPFCLIPKHPYINIPEFRRWDRGTYHPSSCRTPSWYWSQKKIKEGEKRRPWKNSLQSFVCEKEPCLFLQEPTCYNLLRVPSIWRWRIPLQDWIG